MLKNVKTEAEKLEKANMEIFDLHAEVARKEDKFVRTMKKLSHMQEYSNSFKEILDKTLVQLSTIKQMVNHLKDQNYLLETERDSLKNKINSGYFELTPRPDYKELQDKYRLDLNIRTDSKASFKSISLSLILYNYR